MSGLQDWLNASLWRDWWNSRGRKWHVIGDNAPTAAGEQIDRNRALNLASVWCAMRVLCGTGSSLPLRVYQRAEDGSRKPIRGKLSRLLNVAPNPEMTAVQFRAVMWQWQVNAGNAYAEIERVGNLPDGEPVALWPIDPDRVTLARVDGRLVYEVRNENGGGEVQLETWQMLHVPSIITHDGIEGRGVITHARETIAGGIAAEKYGSHWFGGAAVPRVVIEHDGKWEAAQRDAFRTEWAQIYGGPTGKRVAVLEGGAKAKAISINANDSQFLETRQFSIEEIARWYGIPPHLLQHLVSATFNNVEQLGITFVQYSLIPWLEVWEQAIARSLIAEEEQETLFVEHVVDALLRGDLEARGEFYKVMIAIAAMCRNEVRQLENLPPVDGGDVFLVQGATVPIGDDGRPVSEFAGTAGAGPGRTDPEEPASAGRAIVARAAGAIRATIEGSLRRWLTKESKAIQLAAKRSLSECQGRIVAMWQDQVAIIAADIAPAVDALRACGADVTAEDIASQWVASGRRQLEAAAAEVDPGQVTAAIAGVIESQEWASRPESIVKGLSC